MIKYALVTLAMLIALAPQPADASAACPLTPSQAVAGVPFFGTMMTLTSQDGDGTVSYAHREDPRIVVAFSMVGAEPVGQVSRGAYVQGLESYASFLVQRARQQGRWSEKSVYPVDPVAWRMVEQTEVDGVGEAFAGHMEIRMTPSCILVADFLAPASQNLRTRWQQMSAAIASIREQPSLVVAESWEREDTTPTGIQALAAGLMSPLAAIGIIYLLFGQLRRSDPPSGNTRIVLGSCCAVALGTAAYQYQSYISGWSEMRYVDNLLLLAFTGIACAAGAAMAQRAAMLGLVAACITGITLSVASSLAWTPDPAVSLVVGAALSAMGFLGFYAWLETTGRPRGGS